VSTSSSATNPCTPVRSNKSRFEGLKCDPTSRVFAPLLADLIRFKQPSSEAP
jgi:hypothetical protein